MVDPEVVAGALAAAQTAAAPAVRKTLDAFGDGISNSLRTVGRSTIARVKAKLGIGLKDYLENSYEKCREFKNILNPYTPLDLLDKYVSANVTKGKQSISDIELLADIDKYRNIALTGLAGSGKSMFMRYLVVCKFQTPDGRLPLFIEFRHLNNLTDRNLLTYLRTSCSKSTEVISEEHFKFALEEGLFILVLDGFDELNFEVHDEIQNQILKLSIDYPKTVILVSSRPDERFNSWAKFHVFKMAPLSKSQCLTFISKLDYNKGVKQRFSREVKQRLYDSHQSFLSYPLLTTIMLLTYESFAEISDKMHAFYSRAFDTLFQKHDAQKEQFQRKFFTGLSQENFKACFAAFCGLSYLEQKISFSEDALKTAAKNALTYSRNADSTFSKTVTAEQFISDLMKSVCMLHLDGTEVTFVHRSFQEYFSALFVTSIAKSNMKRVMDKYSIKYNDTAISMAYEMSRENVEENWILPTIIEFQEALTPSQADSPFEKTTGFNRFVKAVSFHVSKNGLSCQILEYEPERHFPIMTILRLYQKVRPDFNEMSVFKCLQISKKGLLQLLNDEGNFNQKNYSEFREAYEASELQVNTSTEADSNQLRVASGDGGVDVSAESETSNTPIRISISSLTDEDRWWLAATKLGDFLDIVRKSITEIRKDIEARERKRDNLLEELIKSDPEPF